MSDLSKLLADLNGKKMDPVKKEKLRLELLRAQAPKKDMGVLKTRDVQHDLNADMLDGHHASEFAADPTTQAGDLIYRYGDGTMNYAAASKGTTITAYTESGTHPPALAIDGNASTYYESAWGWRQSPQSLYVKLAAKSEITRFVLVEEGGTGFEGYYPSGKVHYSNDNANWTECSSWGVEGGYAGTGTWDVTFPEVEALYFRFTTTWGSNETTWRVYKIELYAPTTQISFLRALEISDDGKVLTVSNGLPAWGATATPADHATEHVTGGGDVIANAVAGGNSGLMSGTDKSKLDGIAAGAEVNVNADWNAVSGDAQILNKPATYTPAAHNQAASTIDVTDSADYFTGAQVEAILAEVGLNWAKLARANTFTAKQVIVSADEPYSDLALDVHNGGGVELITAQVDRDFSGAGNWSGTNWAISGGKYVHTAGSTAAATLANANLTAGSVMAGRYYAITFTISGASAGNVTVKMGTGSGGVFSADGTYTAWMLANADDVDLILTPSTGFNGALDDLSLKLVPAQFAFTNTGRAAIGTTVPDADSYLHVKVYDSGTVKLKFENLSANTGAAAAVEAKVNNAARVLLIHGGSNVISTTFGAFANRGGLITDSTYGLGIGIAARQAAGNIIFYAGGVASTNEKVKIDVTETVFNDLGDSTVDLRAESDTEANMLFLDASADTLNFGGTTNGVQIDKGGHMTFLGTATVFKDELGRLSGAKLTSPSSKIVQDDAEGAYYYKDTATTSDYLWLNIQLNHDRKHGAGLYPHLHWWQTSANIPNWLLQYRYQKQGAAKTTAWTSVKYTAHAFAYSSGTLGQISTWAAITPASGDGVSDILQVRIIRDYNNTSTLFAGNDPLSGDCYVIDFDIHKECDSVGSNAEYTK